METGKTEEAPKGPRQLLLTSAKIAVAVFLMWVLFSTGKVKLDTLGKIAGSGAPWFGLAVLLFGTALVCGAMRWRLLLAGQGVDLGLADAWRLTLIGHFFNIRVPGSVGGDVVKGYYIARAARSNERATEAATSVILDRVIGLTALAAIAGVAALAAPSFLPDDPKLRVVLGGILVVDVVLVVLAVAVYLGRVPQSLPEMPRRILEAVIRLRQPGSGLWPAFGLSVAAHLMSIFALYGLGQGLGEVTLGLPAYLALCPVAVFVNAVPITPGGIGLGEGALDKLFELAGAGGGDSEANLGGEVFLLLRFAMLGWSVVGGVVYALWRPVSEVGTVKEPEPEPQDAV